LHGLCLACVWKLAATKRLAKGSNVPGVDSGDAYDDRQNRKDIRDLGGARGRVAGGFSVG